MKQAALSDGFAFDPLSFQHDDIAASEVDVGALKGRGSPRFFIFRLRRYRNHADVAASQPIGSRPREILCCSAA
jgi:hypothetical protein